MRKGSRSRSRTRQATGASPRRVRRHLPRLLNRGRCRTGWCCVAQAKEITLQAHACPCALAGWHDRKSQAGQGRLVLVVSEVCGGRYGVRRARERSATGEEGIMGRLNNVPPWEWRERRR